MNRFKIVGNCTGIIENKNQSKTLFILSENKYMFKLYVKPEIVVPDFEMNSLISISGKVTTYDMKIILSIEEVSLATKKDLSEDIPF